MEYLGPKISLVLLSLLLLAQLQKVSASGFFTNWNICGDNNHINYLDRSHKTLFYINGELVDRYLFCISLLFYQQKGCFPDQNVRHRYCGFFDFSVDKLPVRIKRKFSRKVAIEGSMEQQFKTQKSYGKDSEDSVISPAHMAMAASAAFFLCCGVICPCFRARRRTAHTVLREPDSMDSISSMEMISVQEKITASPLRLPGSPLHVSPSPLRVIPGSPGRLPPSSLRAPPSPLRVPPSPPRFSMSPKLDRVGSVHLNMSQVMRATHNFSESMKIGEGGFGTVYKARLPDGQLVAIKRAKKELFENIRTEFRSEVEMLTRIDHRNLVKLLGYVDKGNDRVIITEYVPNGTLREHLDGMRVNILDFKQRLEISIDVAHALTYLHLYAEKQIIHRDVKSSNILLTESMRAKVADFGFARLGDLDSDDTHVLTKVKGTVGYLDPEYMKTNQLTTKSDVYSFGILLLEILTGRRPVELRKPAEERVTLRWAFKKYNEQSVAELMDPLMKEVVDKVVVMKMFGLAIQCAAPTRSDRPDMKLVGEQLWVIRMDYLKSGNIK